MFGKGELISMYRTNFMLIHNFGYSLTELENLIPFEYEIYLLMLQEQLEKEKKARNKNV